MALKLLTCWVWKQLILHFHLDRCMHVQTAQALNENAYEVALLEGAVVDELQQTNAGHARLHQGVEVAAGTSGFYWCMH